MEFINCGDVLETNMSIDEIKRENEEVIEEEVSDPLTQPSNTPSEIKIERSCPSRRSARVASLRSARKRKQPKVNVEESSKVFWCFGVPRHSSCELCFGNCLPLRCRKCKVIRGRSNIIKSYDCSECGKICKDIPEFKKHMESQHVNLKCEVCGKCFANKLRLRAHSKIHKERKYLCELCSFAFHRLDQYKSHYLRKHTDSKNFLCTVCGKAWKTKGDLTQHMRVHDDRYRPVKQIVT